MQQWPFESAATTPCLTVRDVMAGTRPILEAHRDADGTGNFYRASRSVKLTLWW